ncbi:FAD-dependent monooxygenase [Bacillus sp. BRMEA1]|nr:FAD-dependent monooxygenase [Neobacillus endophyticus]
MAQGLKKRGISCSVFEREASPAARGQGYRLNINDYGGFGLQECLPGTLYSLYLATSAVSYNSKVAKFDSALHPIGSVDFGKPGQDLTNSHSAVNRLTLRQILLAGLEGIVQFSRTLIDVEQEGDRVKAIFSDGTVEEGDLLIAADGIRSVVRRRLLPDTEPESMKLVSIYGKIPLNPVLLKQIPDAIYNAINTILGPERTTLIMAFYQSRMPQQEAAAKFAPSVQLDPVDDYLLWGLIAPDDRFPLDLMRLPPEELLQLSIGRINGWSADLIELLSRTDQSSLFALPMHTSHLVPDWQTSRITLMGDAIHAMNPAGGSGASTAFLDAALLSMLLESVSKGEVELIPAIRKYEQTMREYAYPTMESSYQNARKIFLRESEKGEKENESNIE